MRVSMTMAFLYTLILILDIFISLTQWFMGVRGGTFVSDVFMPIGQKLYFYAPLAIVAILSRIILKCVSLNRILFLSFVAINYLLSFLVCIILIYVVLIHITLLSALWFSWRN